MKTGAAVFRPEAAMVERTEIVAHERGRHARRPRCRSFGTHEHFHMIALDVHLQLAYRAKRVEGRHGGNRLPVPPAHDVDPPSRSVVTGDMALAGARLRHGEDMALQA